jgi:hypothetical protein
MAIPKVLTLAPRQQASMEQVTMQPMLTLNFCTMKWNQNTVTVKGFHLEKWSNVKILIAKENGFMWIVFKKRISQTDGTA